VYLQQLRVVHWKVIVAAQIALQLGFRVHKTVDRNAGSCDCRNVRKEWDRSSFGGQLTNTVADGLDLPAPEYISDHVRLVAVHLISGAGEVSQCICGMRVTTFRRGKPSHLQCRLAA